MSTDFEIGQTYNRRQHIHNRFGGQRQSGIVTPSKYPVIFLFTGRGTRHGYEDNWTNEGALEYFGEGQRGDMTLTKGNKAIATHIEEGKDLLLFEMLGRGRVRFVGPFNCAGHSIIPAPDTDGNIRNAIVFELVPVAGEGNESALPPPTSPAVSLSELRQRAMAAAKTPTAVTRKTAAKTYRIRSEQVRQYVLARANGVCESCDQDAPFKMKNGRAYLEPHHIRRLTDGGPDDPRFMGAVCPNCHRDIHHGAGGAARNTALQVKVSAKEATPHQFGQQFDRLGHLDLVGTIPQGQTN
jgi:5-methylcytosine-specific restriction protein A